MCRSKQEAHSQCFLLVLFAEITTQLNPPRCAAHECFPFFQPLINHNSFTFKEHIENRSMVFQQTSWFGSSVIF